MDVFQNMRVAIFFLAAPYLLAQLYLFCDNCLSGGGTSVSNSPALCQNLCKLIIQIATYEQKFC